MRWPIPLEHDPTRRVSPEEFEWALVAGLGRAVSSVVIQEEEFRSALLAASLYTPSIDPQVDPRDGWIASMVETTRDPAFYVEPVLVAGVELEQYGHTRDSQHRVGIIEHFARRGEFGCREWMRRNLVTGRLEYEWLQVAGWRGIVDIAKARGGSGQLDAEADCFIFNAYNIAVEKGSEEAVRALLEREASLDAHVRTYLDAVDAWRLGRQAAAPRGDRTGGFDFSEVDPELKWPRLRGWFESASTEQLETALRWIETSGRDHRWRLISAWKSWGPPLHRFSEELYEWTLAHFETSPDHDEFFSVIHQLYGHSLRLLGTLADPRVRELGLTRLSANDIDAGCELLEGNWQSGDAGLIVDALPMSLPVTLDEKDEHHGLAGGLTGLLEVVDDAGLVPCAQWVYLLNPCAYCRNNAVKWLRQQNHLTPAMEAECVNDAWKHEE